MVGVTSLFKIPNVDNKRVLSDQEYEILNRDRLVMRHIEKTGLTLLKSRQSTLLQREVMTGIYHHTPHPDLFGSR